MIDSNELLRLQDWWTVEWHGAGSTGETKSGIPALAMQNHRANFDLWHEEDKARDPQAADAEIARVKRAIDRLNQQRNDVVEMMDEEMLRAAPVTSADAPLHSETPGMMIDRMSILALKIFHTREQVERSDVAESHRERNRERLRVLEEQRGDLVRCLGTFWVNVLRGERRFKIYRQMKMYNDPELNPSIYGSRTGVGKG